MECAKRVVKHNLGYFVLFIIVFIMLFVVSFILHPIGAIKSEINKNKIKKYIANKDIIKNEDSIHI